jgi:hypothetical protein
MIRRAHLQNASSFLVSRGVNAVLVLVQLALVGRLYGTDEAATFFVFWTVVWAASIGVRFGYDQLLPKHAATAEVSGTVEALRGYRRVAERSIPIVAALSIPLILVVLPDSDLGIAVALLPFIVVGAIGWGGIYLLAALAKGYGHAGVSGWVGGPLAIALPTCAVPIAHALDGGWFLLGVLSSLALAISAPVALAVVSRKVGRDRVHAALFERPPGPADSDAISTGTLTAIAETGVFLPVWIAGALGLSASDVAALYAALRVAAAFSWIFGSVVAVITPMLAAALAQRDYGRLRSLLWRSAGFGVGSTAPLAIIGALLASQILSLFDPAYRDYGDLLVILIAARLLDAATGAVAETLILGNRADWELLNQILGVGALLAIGIGLEPSWGVNALAAASAAWIVVANLARVIELRWLLAHDWLPPTEAARAT